DPAIELTNFGMVAAKEREKTGLGSRRSFGAAEAECVEAVLQFVEVQAKIVTPEAGPLADRRELGGLEVCEAEGGLALPTLGERCEGVDHADQAIAEQGQALSHQDQIGVVGNVAAGRA